MALVPLDVILVRHAESMPIGSAGFADDDRPLTDAGRAAADEMARELDDYHVTAVYSSPYPRSIETVRPIAEGRGMEVQVIGDLRERRLSPGSRPDWREHLERGWAEADYVPDGGESGRAAQRRAVGILDLLRSRHPDGGRLVVGSHGNLIALILQALEPDVDFAFHMAMPTPALYRLTHDGIRWRVMGGHGFRAAEGQESTPE